MSLSIGNSGGPRDAQSVPSGGAGTPTGSGGRPQLGQTLSILVAEFGGHSSPDQIAALLGGLRQLVNAGLPVEDIADAMYASPGVLSALKDGDPETAKERIVSRLIQDLAELRDSGVPEERLRLLSEAGFSAGEIASVLRSVPNLRDTLVAGDPENAKQLAATLHDFFRESGRSIHNEASLIVLQAERTVPGLSAAQASWFEQYTNRIRAAQKLTLQPAAQADFAIAALVESSPAQEAHGHLSDWVIGILLAVAALVFILSHC
jgi:hypothetical protein